MCVYDRERELETIQLCAICKMRCFVWVLLGCNAINRAYAVISCVRVRVWRYGTLCIEWRAQFTSNDLRTLEFYAIVHSIECNCDAISLLDLIWWARVRGIVDTIITSADCIGHPFDGINADHKVRLIVSVSHRNVNHHLRLILLVRTILAECYLFLDTRLDHENKKTCTSHTYFQFPLTALFDPFIIQKQIVDIAESVGNKKGKNGIN